jgi:flagellar biosynthesis regulator FlaF
MIMSGIEDIKETQKILYEMLKDLINDEENIKDEIRRGYISRKLHDRFDVLSYCVGRNLDYIIELQEQYREQKKMIDIQKRLIEDLTRSLKFLEDEHIRNVSNGRCCK